MHPWFAALLIATVSVLVLRRAWDTRAVTLVRLAIRRTLRRRRAARALSASVATRTARTERTAATASGARCDEEGASEDEEEAPP